MSVEKILLDKFNFRKRIKDYDNKVTHYEDNRRDAWSMRLFNQVGFEYRYDMVISNLPDALKFKEM